MDRAAVLIDVDGTLVDSNYHHAMAWSRAFRDNGERAHLAAIHRAIGMGSTDLLQSLIGNPDPAITDAWRRHFEALLPEVAAFDGAGELLRAFHRRGVCVVLATSSPEDLLDTMRVRIGADDAIDIAITAADVERAKPHPDIFDVALERAGVRRDHAMVLGDSVWDVESATRAGLRAIGLEAGGFSRLELEEKGAIAVYRDPADLLDHLPASPFAALWT